MATSTRHSRRKAAKARLQAKSERIARAELGRALEERRAIVRSNMATPMERNYYPQSSMANMAACSHRGYVCRASGGGVVRR